MPAVVGPAPAELPVVPPPPEPLDPAFSCGGCEAVTELIGRVRRLEQAINEIRIELETR